MCNYLSLLMDYIFDRTGTSGGTATHTEEGASRRQLDATDKQKPREQIQRFGNPLESTAKVVASDFIENLPGGFLNLVHIQVYTMEIMKKGVKLGDQTTATRWRNCMAVVLSFKKKKTSRRACVSLGTYTFALITVLSLWIDEEDQQIHYCIQADSSLW